jgi:hypothetical protein
VRGASSSSFDLAWTKRIEALRTPMCWLATLGDFRNWIREAADFFALDGRFDEVMRHRLASSRHPASSSSTMVAVSFRNRCSMLVFDASS